jgi:ankyrin repeat protein
MRTRETSRSLLIYLLAFVTVFAVVRGQAAGDNPLIAAAKDGDLPAVRALIAKRANVNERAGDGSTALLWAVYNSNLEMTRALIAAGAAVDTPNQFGITPLLQAARTGEAPVISALLKAGADVKRAIPDYETPLMAAARTGRVDAVRLLIESGANVNAADDYQEETALMWAATEGHAEIVKVLIQAGADPDATARMTTIWDRKHGDHPTGGFSALMFAARNGHDAAARALLAGGADPKVINGDGVTATTIAIVNDRFDLAKTLIDLGADPNDGSLYFAVDMHDATTDMRARDGSRLRANHANTLTALDLVKLMLDRGADANQPFVGQLHSTTLCCGDDINSSPFYRAAIASDVEVLKLMLAHGAKVEWSPAEIKKKESELKKEAEEKAKKEAEEKAKDVAAGATPGGRGANVAAAAAAAPPGGRGVNANVGKTPIMMAMTGGRGASFAAGPGFDRLGPPPFREASNRDPVDAVKVLLAAGANPNVKAPDGSTPLHQAVQARKVAVIRELVAAGAKLDAVNKDNLTPLLLAEKPEPPPPPGNNNDPNTYRPKRESREEVIAAVRELMGLGPNDPAPEPPPLPVDAAKKADDKTDGATTDEKKADEKKPAVVSPSTGN